MFGEVYATTLVLYSTLSLQPAPSLENWLCSKTCIPPPRKMGIQQITLPLESWLFSGISLYIIARLLPRKVYYVVDFPSFFQSGHDYVKSFEAIFQKVLNNVMKGNQCSPLLQNYLANLDKYGFNKLILLSKSISFFIITRLKKFLSNQKK